MGYATIPMDKPQQYSSQNVMKGYSLFEKGKEGPVSKPGRLWLIVFHTDNMAIVWQRGSAGLRIYCIKNCLYHLHDYSRYYRLRIVLIDQRCRDITRNLS